MHTASCAAERERHGEYGGNTLALPLQDVLRASGVKCKGGSVAASIREGFTVHEPP